MAIFYKKSFCSFVVLFAVSFTCLAASVVQVDRISFDKLGRDEWIRARLQMSVSGNPSPNAKNPRFLDGMKVSLFLSYGDKKNGFDFYSSEVDLVTLEQGQRYLVDFFLPGSVVKRDRLSTNPFAYLVQFDVGSHVVPFEAQHGSSNMGSEVARNTIVSKANETASQTAGILVPSYHAPYYLWIEDEEEYPAFKRITPSKL